MFSPPPPHPFASSSSLVLFTLHKTGDRRITFIKHLYSFVLDPVYKVRTVHVRAHSPALMKTNSLSD